MQAHRIETTVQPNGKIVLENLPFDEGEAVEIIVLETKIKKEIAPKSLHGTLLKYENPFEPIGLKIGRFEINERNKSHRNCNYSA